MSKIETRMGVSVIIEYLSMTKEAAEFLHEQSIAKVDAVESIERYEAADGRKGLIMNLHEAGSEALSKLIIDIRAGQPSTDQVYDAVYGVGKECTKRVIVFTDEVNIDEEVNPTVDEYAVRSLVEAMNAYPLKLYLVNFNDDALHPELKEKDVFEDESPDLSIADIPTPERFRAEEFWAVYFDWHNELWYKAWKVFSDGVRELTDWGHMLFTEPEVAEIPVYWTNDGIKFLVKQTEEEGDYLRKVWTLKQNELKERYQGRVEFEFLPGRLPKITVKYSDRPVSWLITATPKERLEFAKQLHSDIWGFRWYLSEAMEEAETVLAA
jgi:hypothetical protein